MIFQKQIEKIYKSNIFVRNDNSHGIFYFGPGDFPGLKSHAYDFKANAGHDLRGLFYHYDNPIPGRLLVFDHGMGNGHRAYMREIETLCKAGFLVYSYDHTGCMESGGESTNGFAQSLNDLDCCISNLKTVGGFKGEEITVIGHSWGGFSTQNIAALHPDLKNVVALSGFSSVKRMINQNFGGVLKGYAKAVYALEERTNPEYVKYDAVETLANTDVRALIIHSGDDPQVKREFHFDIMRSALADRKNVEFVLLSGKAHSPNYTYEAVKYKDAFFATLTEKLKKKQLETAQQKADFVAGYDWWAMTMQDMDVWNRIFEFIE